MGTVQVTDDRGFGADWTATVSATDFTTGTATPAETIPASDAFYDITALSQTTGTAAFSYVPVTDLTETPQAVAAAADPAGNTTATWDPVVEVTVPASAIVGSYTATITYSVSLPARSTAVGQAEVSQDSTDRAVRARAVVHACRSS